MSDESMPVSFRRCPNCGGVSFFTDVQGGMVFLRVLPDGRCVANRPPHGVVDIVARVVKCLSCAWHGAPDELAW